MEQDDRELLIRLDERAKAERDRVDYHLAALAFRVAKLESRPVSLSLPHLGNWGWFKITLAACLTLGVWLTTGDPKAALRAAGAPFAMQ